MKCARCGYFNLPGVEGCGRCGAGGAAPETAAPETFYPPRARDRSLAARLGEQARPPEPVRALAGRAAESAGSALTARLRAGEPARWARIWLFCSLSLVPGLGQLASGQRRLGAGLLGAGVVLLAAAALLARAAISDTLLFLLLVVCVYSVWDAAAHAFPPRRSTESEAHRFFRLGLFAASVVAFTGIGVYLLVAQRYPVWVVNSPFAAPVLLRGDGIVLERRGGISPRYRRGETVAVISNPYNAFVQPVLGVGGDRVAVSSDGLRVNERPVPPAAMPLGYSGGPPISVTVPRGSVAVWTPAAVPISGNPIQVVHEDDLDGRLLAIFSPPRRRRWFR